ncbi:MAG: aldehyde ferredoxin oxidoreductase [Deltaproteobacteria bacterium]|nr:aldehyde ferredoxin oxidoreductase [Deltaproteobacteria bacterium]
MIAMYEQKTLHVKLDSGFYRVERIRDLEVLGPVDFGFRQWLAEDALCFGGGPFMGSVLPGSNRLVVTGYSPCWHGFFVSSVGGAGYTFENVGLNYVSLTGRCNTPSVLVLRREGQEEVEVELAPVDPRAVWRASEENPERDRPFRLLERHIWDRFAASYSTPPRVLTVGPAALSTDCGAIGSSKTDRHGLSHVEGWAGRGGLGSRLAREHNLFGIIFGGSYVDQDFDDRKLADAYFEQRYQMRMVLKDRQATNKYRYDDNLKTGGTFGVNMAKLKDRLFHFNYRSVSWPRERRLAAHRDLVLAHYLEQFNRETIDTKEWEHCGEPCPAVCKKMRGPYKKDYEPYQALGPLVGVYDQRCAEHLVGAADGNGFDAIQIGGVVAWLMELVADGLVSPADWGLPQRPVFELDGFRAVEDSQNNEAAALTLLRALAESRGELDLRDGARMLARRIGKRIGKTREVLDRLVVNCASECGWMVPNQYWVPGMFSPMAIMGKYYEHYGDDFVPPRALGSLNAGRMAAELLLDNLGFCRFHREWAEELAPQIMREYLKVDVDLAAHHRRLARRIHARNRSVFFESSRAVEVVHAFMRRKLEEGVDRPELGEWLVRFDADPRAAARDYWFEVRKGVDDALEEKFEAAR